MVFYLFNNMVFKFFVLLTVIYIVGFFYWMNQIEPKISYVQEHSDEELKQIIIIKLKVIAWFVYYKQLKNYNT